MIKQNIVMKIELTFKYITESNKILKISLNYFNIFV